MLPSVILKKLIVENITAARIMDLDIAHAIEFMIERVWYATKVLMHNTFRPFPEFQMM